MAAILALALAAGCGGSETGGARSEPADTVRPTNPVAAVAVPEAVEIPSIGVEARVVPIGLKADGDMQTPDFGLAGWYALGPRPGEVGPAVIAAHVDSRSGPDVFARLSELEPGDRIVVRTEAGTSQAFAVESSEQTPKDALPVDRIWGQTAGPTLRLVTCGGSFDQASGHYRDNVIVYARAL